MTFVSTRSCRFHSTVHSDVLGIRMECRDIQSRTHVQTHTHVLIDCYTDYILIKFWTEYTMYKLWKVNVRFWYCSADAQIYRYILHQWTYVHLYYVESVHCKNTRTVLYVPKRKLVYWGMFHLRPVLTRIGFHENQNRFSFFFPILWKIPPYGTLFMQETDF